MRPRDGRGDREGGESDDAWMRWDADESVTPEKVKFDPHDHKSLALSASKASILAGIWTADLAPGIAP